MCATHNEKLTRSVCTKKMCEKNNECVGVTWVNREVTSLTCPAAKKVCLKSNTELDTDYKAATCNKIIFFIFEGILCFPGEM